MEEVKGVATKITDKLEDMMTKEEETCAKRNELKEKKIRRRGSTY